VFKEKIIMTKLEPTAVVKKKHSFILSPHGLFRNSECGANFVLPS
jgi:hypothetical protein